MGKIAVTIAIGVVFVVLCMGLWTLWKGGAVAATWSNRLMRIRVLAQFIVGVFTNSHYEWDKFWAYFTRESILGGVVARIGDHVFDGSVKNRLDELKHELSR